MHISIASTPAAAAAVAAAVIGREEGAGGRRRAGERSGMGQGGRKGDHGGGGYVKGCLGRGVCVGGRGGVFLQVLHDQLNETK